MLRTPTERASRLLQRVLVVALLPLAVTVSTGQAASAAGSQVIGSGSTHAAVAVRQWSAQAQSLGLPVNYTPSGSPTGLSLFVGGQTDFAATEASYSDLGMTDPQRGQQQVPTVGGGFAVTYNVRDNTGARVDALHLTRETVARILIGRVTSWADPAITAANRGAVLPDGPITVVHQFGPSGTTALVYDFVADTLGAEYASWFASSCQGDPAVRPIDVVASCGRSALGAKVTAIGDPEERAQLVANDSTGAGTFAVDSYSYARKFQVPTAWVQNAAGAYTQPYAENVAAALQDAVLRPDLSQDLARVHASTRPAAYPISAYSYLVTQCGGGLPTCAGGYSDPGKTETLVGFLSYVACGGQTSMAELGYSPLPPELSQVVADAVGRLTGEPAAQLNAANCANPRFAGNLGAGAIGPCDPYACGGPGPLPPAGSPAGSPADLAVDVKAPLVVPTLGPVPITVEVRNHGATTSVATRTAMLVVGGLAVVDAGGGTAGAVPGGTVVDFLTPPLPAGASSSYTLAVKGQGAPGLTLLGAVTYPTPGEQTLLDNVAVRLAAHF